MKFLSTNEILVSVILTVATIGMVFPYGFPLFLPLVLIVAIYFYMRKQIIFRINTSVLLFFLLIVFYIFGLLFNNGVLYERNISDTQNIASIVILWIIISSLTKSGYKKVVNYYLTINSWIFIVISIISLYKFYMLNKGIQLQIIAEKNARYPWGTSLISDYNMFSFALSIGVISGIYVFKNSSNNIVKYSMLFSIILCSATILLSGSRRGWIILIIVLMFFIYSIWKEIIRNKIVLFSVFFITTVIAAYFIFIFDFSMFKQSTNFAIYEMRFRSISSFEGFDTRSPRWSYAIELFKENNLVNMVFGNGFTYLEQFASYFNTDVKEDYPHSPILSSFLYSGIVGGTIVVVFYLSLLIKTILYRKYYDIEIVLIFFISLMYSLISGNSVFSNTLALCFMLLIMMNPLKSKFD